MGRPAVLPIEMDASGVVRAFGQMRGANRSAQAAMSADERRALSERKRFWQQWANEADRIHRQLVAAQDKREREAARVVARAVAERVKAEKKAAGERERSEKSATRSAERESRLRQRAAEKEARTAEHEAQRTATARERAERAATRTAEREAQKRLATVQREATGTGRAIGQIAMRVGSAAASGASAINGQIQDARQRRAGAEHTLNAAFYQAGVGGAEGAGLRARLQAEVSSGTLRGMSMQDAASALMEAQTQFSVLAGPNADARRGAFEQQLQMLAFARNTYQDPGEVLRAGGMLHRQGLRGADLTNTLMTMTGIAQAGSVELSTMISQGLGPLMQNIAASSRLGMSADERSAMVRRATIETMAAGEVGAAAGLSSRDSLNALAKVRRGLSSERMAGNLYGALRDRGISEERIGTLLETTRDARGRTVRRFRSQDALGNLTGMLGMVGGDTSALLNMLQGGGRGTPMVMDAQVRRLIGGLSSQSTNGRTVAETVQNIIAQGQSFSAADVGRGATMRDQEQQTAIVSAQEEHDNVLTDNTSAIVNLSNSVRDWQVRNPFAAQTAESGGGLARDLVGGVLPGAIGAGMGSRPGSGSGTGGTPTPGRPGTGGSSAGNVFGSIAAGLALAGGQIQGLTGRDSSGRQLSTVDRAMLLNPLTTGVAMLAQGAEAAGFFRGIREAVTQGLQSVRVSLDPTTAAHAASSAAREQPTR